MHFAPKTLKPGCGPVVDIGVHVINKSLLQPCLCLAKIVRKTRVWKNIHLFRILNLKPPYLHLENLALERVGDDKGAGNVLFIGCYFSESAHDINKQFKSKNCTISVFLCNIVEVFFIKV